MICFCWSRNGVRIPGWSWWTSKEEIKYCACSRRQYELRKLKKDVSLHCTENGNYEELQCHNGICWCVEPETGKPTQRAYPDSLMSYLPCYNKKTVGSQYLRQCESKSVMRVKLIEKLGYHGHQNFHLDNVFCDYDGTYGRYQIYQNMIRCTWKDGSKIQNYQANVQDLSRIDCNCARDTIIFAEKNIEFRLSCDSNGNYKSLQNSNECLFCVDKDGFTTTNINKCEISLSCKE